MNKPLAYLPNIPGFSFTGTLKDGSKVACIVKVDDKGLHYVADGQGNRVFSQLSTWS